MILAQIAFSQGFFEIWDKAEKKWEEGNCQRAIDLMETTRKNVEARKHPAYEKKMKMLGEWQDEMDEMEEEVENKASKMNRLRMEIIQHRDAFQENTGNAEKALEEKNKLANKFQRMERLYSELDPKNIKCQSLKKYAESKRESYYEAAEPIHQTVVESSDTMLFSALDSITVLNKTILDTVNALLDIHKQDQLIIEAYEAREDTIRDILSMPYFENDEFETPRTMNSVIDLAIQERGSRIKTIADMLAALYKEKYDNDPRFVYEDTLYWEKTRDNLEKMQERLRQNPHLGAYGEEYARYLNKPISIINKSFGEKQFPIELIIGIIALGLIIAILLIMILVKVAKSNKAQKGPIVIDRE